MITHDWDAVMKIYKQGIDSGLSTFSTHYPSWEEWDSGHRKECRYVAACVKGAKGMNCEKCDTAMFQAKMDGGYMGLPVRLTNIKEACSILRTQALSNALFARHADT